MHIPTNIAKKNMICMSFKSIIVFLSTLLHLERPKLHIILAFLSATGFMSKKKTYKNAFLALHFLFLDEQFYQNEEKSLG